MTERVNVPLEALVAKIFEQLTEAGFSPGTIGLYERYFTRLLKMAKSLGKEVFDQELAQLFIADNAYRKGGGYCHSRFLYHSRCIKLMESYIRDGIADFSIFKPAPTKNLKCQNFKMALTDFNSSMHQTGLKRNTRESYVRFVFYFLSYLEGKHYESLLDVQAGDMVFFMVLVCQEHYAPTSLGACVPGLRLFVRLHPELQQYEIEIPERLLKKKDILPSYTKDELEKIDKILSGSSLSARNRAIAIIAFRTGLRAVDICSLQIGDLDWEHDTINLVQEKTGKPLSIPILPSLGNALMAYLLEERPTSESVYVFLSSVAPHRPIVDHAGIYNILRKVLFEAEVEPDGRISGTRMTRHSYATRMLRNGVALPIISEALGHNSPNSTMRYLSTDRKIMAECVLPLPKGGKA